MTLKPHPGGEGALCKEDALLALAAHFTPLFSPFLASVIHDRSKKG